MPDLRLQAFIGLDGTQFEATLTRLGRRIATVFSAGAIAATLRSMSARTIEYADKIGDMSKRLTLSTDFLQRFDAAAKKSGSSVDDLISVVEKFNQIRLKAIGGDKESLEFFKRLGFSPGQLPTLAASNFLTSAAKAVKDGSSADWIAAFKEVGIKGAGAFFATFKDGLADEMAKAPIISAENIAAIKMVKDEFTALGHALLVQFAPALVAVGKTALELGVGLRTAYAFAKAIVTGSRIGAATDAAQRVGLEEMGKINELDLRIAKAAEEFRNPEQPSGIFKPLTTAKIPKPVSVPSDSLVSVGNFLGSSQGQIVTIAQQQLDLLRLIQNNTKELVRYAASGATGFTL